jgi:Helix-turn-helix domain of resolvase
VFSEGEIQSLRLKIQNGEKKAQVPKEFKISRETLYQYMHSGKNFG